MRKVLAFLIALAAFAVVAFGYDAWCVGRVRAAREAIVHDNSDARNSCAVAIDTVGDAAVVMGSSELSAYTDMPAPDALFGSTSDFEVVLFGRGYTQCLLHAIDVGAYAKSLRTGKVVLILSPQWFEREMEVEAFPDRFHERAYAAFLGNGDIPASIKREVAARVEESLVDDPTELATVQLYDAVMVEKDLNPAARLQVLAHNTFMNAKANHDYAQRIGTLPAPKSGTSPASEIDWDDVLEQATELGRKSCTNNDFFIQDEYFDEYVREGYESGENKNGRAGSSMRESTEWGDFELFLQVCEATGVEPLVVSVPVNGRWYDYAGFDRAERAWYYQQVRDLCAAHGAELADFSDREYEAYFLKDIMHLGWRGWAHVCKAIYEYYSE